MTTNFLFPKVCWQHLNSNVLPLHLKQTFPQIIWIFTEGDGIESSLPFKIFSTLILIVRQPRAKTTIKLSKPFKQIFPPIIWIFTEGDGIESSLLFNIFSTLILIAIPYFFDFIVGLSGSHVPKQPSLIAVHAIGRKRDWQTQFILFNGSHFSRWWH